MPDSPKLDHSANSPLTQLIEIDAELAVQEVDLLSQLTSVQEKRQSLKTVISLFTETDISPPTVAASPQLLLTKTDEEPGSVGEDLAAAPLESSKTLVSTEVTTETASAEPKKVKRTAPSSTSRNKTTKVKPATKTAKKSSRWQDYVRAEFSNISLPEVVALVLKRQADAVLEIPTIVQTIFGDEMPQEAGRQARRQVTNILGHGALKGKWYRGQLGSYSMSRAATQAT